MTTMLKSLIFVRIKPKSDNWSDGVPFAFTKKDFLSMVETGEIDRNLSLTPEDIIWLRRWLPKIKGEPKFKKLESGYSISDTLIETAIYTCGHPKLLIEVFEYSKNDLPDKRR